MRIASKVLICCLVILHQVALHAQIEPPIPDQPGTPTPPAPIDDYIPLLLVAGIAFGACTIWKLKKGIKN